MYIFFVFSLRTKLEQAYRLCPRCERSLKRTLNRVKTNVLGSKLKQIGAKGLRAFDLSKTDKRNKKTVYKKRHLCAQIALFALISISSLQLYVISNQIDITKQKLDSVFNAQTTNSILTVFSYFAAAKIMIADLLDNFLGLPYISLIMTSVRLFINNLYALTNGDIWTLINTNVSSLLDLNIVEDNTSVEMSTMIINLSGCFMSIFLLFLIGLEIGPVLSLLFWSCNMIIPSMAQDPSMLQSRLLLDIVQVKLKINFLTLIPQTQFTHSLSKLVITWSLLLLSLVNAFTVTKKGAKTDDANSSFHRLESESNSDVSESEAESELETSLRSTSSTGSGRRFGWNKTQILNSTISSNSPSIISNGGALRQRPFTASTQSLSNFHSATNKINTSFGSECNFKRTNPTDIPHSKFIANQSAFEPPSQQNQLNRSQFRSQPQHQSDADTELTLRCMSRNSLYDIPDDFESGITQLSISGIGGGHRNYRKQTRIFGSSDRIRESLQKSVLAPARFNGQENMQLHANQSSWLAGGYWNNSTSPQKRSVSQMSQHHPEPSLATRTSYDVFPMMSRTSSHSSGFESMRNSTTNNSRENSLCGEVDNDRTFLFCEPQQMVVKPQPQKSTIASGFGAVNGMNALSIDNDPAAMFRSIATPSASSVQSHNFNLPGPMPTRKTADSWIPFSQQSRTSLPSRSPSIASHEQLNSLNNAFSNDLPMRPYQRGSLIKLNTTNDI